jgi:hypothetical protein
VIKSTLRATSSDQRATKPKASVSSSTVPYVPAGLYTDDMITQGAAALVIAVSCAALVGVLWLVNRRGRMNTEWQRLSLCTLFAATAGAFALSKDFGAAGALCACTAAMAVVLRPRQ